MIVARFNAWCASQWTSHGTKILGFGTAVVGALEYVDSKTLDAIVFVFGPHYGPIFSHAIIVGAGFATAKRGWTNQSKGTPS